MIRKIMIWKENGKKWSPFEGIIQLLTWTAEENHEAHKHRPEVRIL